VSLVTYLVKNDIGIYDQPMTLCGGEFHVALEADSREHRLEAGKAGAHGAFFVAARDVISDIALT
jgi:hypothetical protein